jgi:hypothetical protein
MLDATCTRCLQDVAVQRQVRTGVANRLLPVMAEPAVCRGMRYVTKFLDQSKSYAYFPEIARGLSMPTPASPMYMRRAAIWGHWQLMHEAQHEGATLTDVMLTHRAAEGGQLRVLQKLRLVDCPWHREAVAIALSGGHYDVAVWAMLNGAPPPLDWLVGTINHENLRLLRWAYKHGRLPATKIPKLRAAAKRRCRWDVVMWLDGLVRGQVCLS